MGTRKGAGAAEPTLTASNGEPVCPGAGDRRRSQEHSQAADQGQALGPDISSGTLPPICIHFLYVATSHHKLDGLNRKKLTV